MKMEDNLCNLILTQLEGRTYKKNGRRPQKINKMKDYPKKNGRQPQKKGNKGRRPLKKMEETSNKNGRRPLKKMEDDL
jgi:hypothetical protein